MSKLALLLLLGVISVDQIQAEPHHEEHLEVECPFGHKHKTQHHKKHGFSWGILDITKSANETDYDHYTHTKEFGTSWFGNLYNYFIHPSHEYEEDKHEGCPFYNAFKELFHHKKKHHKKHEHMKHKLNIEQHDSPFYEHVEKEVETPDDLVDPLSNGVPTAVFHGLGDACIFPGDIQLDHEIEKGTGAYTTCIEVGLPSLGEYFNNFEHVAEVSCRKVIENKNFQGEFNVVGLSQGGLLARYIAEECDIKGKVRNMVTLGGPHMGVDAVPHCYEGFICNIVNFFIKKLVYLSIAQNWVAPAGYFRDVNNMSTYLKKSVFLPKVNNELSHPGSYSALRKSKFTDLNAAMFVKFS